MPEPGVLHATVSAWAKINLDLRILSREESGYHQLETIFQRISLCDDVDVTVERGTGISVTCVPAIDVPMEKNLAWRAADSYRTAAAWPDAEHAVRIAITKRIPTGGGLGGGSADAGAVLRALNSLNPQPIATHELLRIAARLGADVPFLTTDCACALAWGRGERMMALDALPERVVHLAFFDVGVNTGQAYGWLAESRSSGLAAAQRSGLYTRASLATWEQVTHISANDFEAPIFARRDDIAGVHGAFVTMFPGALVRMSGSGATVFAVAPPSQPTPAPQAMWFEAPGVRNYDISLSLHTVPPVQNLSVQPGHH
jgi:4-diphosphocytidyl-2-C-methyl-D-erythritol kinase